MRLFTSRYRNSALNERQDLHAVGITLGEPRIPVQYPLTSTKPLAPPRRLLDMDRERFSEVYGERLDEIDVERIRRPPTAISRENDGCELVLLCFEDVHKEGEWHDSRRMVPRADGRDGGGVAAATQDRDPRSVRLAESRKENQWQGVE
jgi:hypothetical protein